MCMSFAPHFATEKRSMDWCLKNIPAKKRSVVSIIAKVSTRHQLNKNSKILELGCAQGLYLLALQDLGYKKVVGIEPSKLAMNKLGKLSQKLGRTLNARLGCGEDLPYKDNSLDLVIADSVMEHVDDQSKVFKEVGRVLKPGGAFYVKTTSVACPHQFEIRFFPCFSWYPDAIKKAIMKWSVKNAPSLVGYSDTPAINWYSARCVRKLASDNGFSKIYSRWDLIDESSRKKSVILGLVSSNLILKFIAQFFIPASTYLLIK